MGVLDLLLQVPVESISWPPVSGDSLQSALRRAIKLALDSDPILRQYGLPVAYRMSRKFIQLPSITYFDYGTQDEFVPLWDRTLQVDVWTQSDLDLAEDVAKRIQDMWSPRGLTGLPIGALPRGEGVVAHMHLTQDMDGITEDADIVRKTLLFRMLVYQLN